ncbi:hypothetical protein PV10_09237 [Exophiala mesophila]|uniref:Uncharacterized protein n=1 Tax=Exophiala mesophila TaxID=212818 RepID=A0A0D1WGR9_EXOME|nr:uncharacterized protein PV10_09237 [Exophiala mesophila]KIV87960.1 hypothetical protein PV10_09237 [Exophiala mesophila]
MRMITRIPSLLGLVILFSSLFYLYENRNLIEHGNLHSVDYWHSIKDAAESHIPRLNPHHQKPLANSSKAAPVETIKANTTASPLQVALPQESLTPPPAKAEVPHNPAKSSVSEARRVAIQLPEPSSARDQKSKTTTSKATSNFKEPGHDKLSSSRKTGASQSQPLVPVKSGKSFSAIQGATKKGQQYNGPRRNSLPMPYPAGMLS